jgi:hypothetical protein
MHLQAQQRLCQIRAENPAGSRLFRVTTNKRARYPRQRPPATHKEISTMTTDNRTPAERRYDAEAMEACTSSPSRPATTRILSSA